MHRATQHPLGCIDAHFFVTFVQWQKDSDLMSDRGARLSRSSACAEQFGLDGNVRSDALSDRYFEIENLGNELVASPSDADMPLVMRPVSRQVAGALRRTHGTTPHPKFELAVGNVTLPGCPPPPPLKVLHTILGAVRLRKAGATTSGKAT